MININMTTTLLQCQCQVVKQFSIFYLENFNSPLKKFPAILGVCFTMMAWISLSVYFSLGRMVALFIRV